MLKARDVRGGTSIPVKIPQICKELRLFAKYSIEIPIEDQSKKGESNIGLIRDEGVEETVAVVDKQKSGETSAKQKQKVVETAKIPLVLLPLLLLLLQTEQQSP